MLKKLYQFIDFFLPNQLSEFVDIAVLYQARVVVAANLTAFIVASILFVVANFLGLALLIKLGILTGCILAVGLIIFLKTRLVNFERYLHIGAGIQISILFFMFYMMAFSQKGMGFFSLIWLIPLFLMSAFILKPKYSLIYFIVNFIVLLSVLYSNIDKFYYPINNVSNFQYAYTTYFIFVVFLSFLLSYIFVQFNFQLQQDNLKKKELLIESAKFQSLGQMASNLAHDINNPLFTIQGKLHQMRNLLYRDQLDLASCDRIIENVESTILRLSQIVKGVSTFARQGSGDQMVSVRVQDLIESVMVISEDRFKKNNIKLKIDINQSSNVICYPSFISQVLQNIFNNAIDSLENEESRIVEIEAFTNEEWVEIHVRDSGKGIPKDIEKKIFDPFFTTKKFGKGTGLGLSISKGLVDVHDGELFHTMEKGMTTFVIRLPSYE